MASWPHKRMTNLTRKVLHCESGTRHEPKKHNLALIFYFVFPSVLFEQPVWLANMPQHPLFLAQKKRLVWLCLASSAKHRENLSKRTEPLFCARSGSSACSPPHRAGEQPQTLLSLSAVRKWRGEKKKRSTFGVIVAAAAFRWWQPRRALSITWTSPPQLHVNT